MLPKSRKPEIIRLHSLQQYQRDRFISSYLSTLSDWFPSAFRHKLFSHPVLKNIVPDIYFTFVTICLCRKRLGEQYTYVTMCKDSHYEDEGVLVNKKFRLLVFVLQIIGRNLLRHLLQKIQNRINLNVTQPTFKAFLKCIGNSSEILSNLQWLLMMLFMLNITKSPNFIDIKLGLGYIYTFFNESQTKISYKFQGLLLLAVFIIQFVNFFFNLRKEIAFFEAEQVKTESRMIQKSKQSQGRAEESQNETSELCRICYDQIKQKSCTKCGHVFCWQCIISSLEMNAECPMCRTRCQPREVIQLVNF